MGDANWLDEGEAAAWRGLMRMHAALTHELGRRLASDSDLSYRDYEVLVALTDQPEERLRMYELAEVLGWEKSRASHQVARMLERGLVRRVTCATDRRGSVVVATARGRRAIEAAAPGHVAAVRELFIDRLSREQLAGLSEIAARVLATG